MKAAYDLAPLPGAVVRLAALVAKGTYSVATRPPRFTRSISDHLRWLAAAREQGGESSLQAEIEILGVHHGELGGLIASHWNLPPRVVQGITYHHAPATGCDVICDVAHVANVLAKRAGTGHVATPLDLDAQPDALKRLGLATGRLATLEDSVRDRLAQAVERFG